MRVGIIQKLKVVGGPRGPSFFLSSGALSRDSRSDIGELTNAVCLTQAPILLLTALSSGL
jgi:hypothetical protein